MGGNLAKSPLIAVCFAALLGFVAAFVPFSGVYAPLWEGYGASPYANLMLVVYGLWICVAAALVFAGVQSGGAKLLAVTATTFLVILFVSPMIEDLLLGEISGAMTRWDTAACLIIGGIATVLALVLCLLLYRVEASAASRRGKPKLRVKPLLITLVVLPFVYLVIYFLGWYFLGWRDDAVRAFWKGAAQNRGIADAFVNMLLETPELIPVALLRGLLLAGSSLLLAVQMASRRALYVAVNVMLFAGAAVALLIPTPAVPQTVRWMLLLQQAATMLPYAVATALLLHRTIELPAASAADAAPGARRAGSARPAAVRR